MSEMKNSSAPRENEDEWNDARSRVEAYLQALRFADVVQNEKIIQRVLTAGAAKKPERPADNLTALAMRELHSEMERWFGTLLGSSERTTVRGVLSLSTMAMLESWPSVFLEAEVPADFQQALRENDVRAAPHLSKSTMVPQPFPNPLSEINLPAPLGEMARGLAPLVTKVFLVVFALFIWLTGGGLKP